MATHSSILARRIPSIEEPGRLQSMGSQRVVLTPTNTVHCRQTISVNSWLWVSHRTGSSPLFSKCRNWGWNSPTAVQAGGAGQVQQGLDPFPGQHVHLLPNPQHIQLQLQENSNQLAFSSNHKKYAFFFTVSFKYIRHGDPTEELWASASGKLVISREGEAKDRRIDRTR